MSNVDYLTVSGSTDGQHVADVIGRLAGAAPRPGNNRWIVLPDDERAQVTIYQDPDSDTGWIATVYYAGDLSERRKIAQSIYDGLMRETKWGLELDSDDAEDIIARRSKSAA